MKGFTRKTILAGLIPFITSGCGSGSSSEEVTSITSVNINGVPTLESIYSYEDTENAEQVVNCSTLFLESKSCDVADIKPLGADIEDDLTIEDIKSRLVVSNDWMADSFIAALTEIDDQDLLNLFKSLNTIVISYDIIPSFYHAYTASLYIDPRYLWRDSDEWNTIYEQEDYRVTYQTEFIFETLSRYIDGTTSEYITYSNSYDEDYYNSRTVPQIAPALYRLLSHELAHANDYLPADTLSSIGDEGEIYSDYIYNADHVYEALNDAIPLSSSLLYDAAQIAYQGEDMTDTIRGTTGEDIGVEFDQDGGAALYSYSTSREDVAMLFEEFMMYKKYGAVKDVAFTTVPSGDSYSCDDYLIEWGQRNRLADATVKVRTELVGGIILGRDISSDLPDDSSEPIMMETDIGWCESQDETTSVTTNQANSLLLRVSQSEVVVHHYQDDIDR